MPIFIPTVEECPVARQSKGLIEIDPEILGWLAGAVRKEPDEWLVILLGEYDQGGLHVIVDDVYVPPRQYRTTGTCRVNENENSLEGLPDHIVPRTAGVLHSHHKMGANFSSGQGGDKGPDGVNNTFPMSIVISSSYTPQNEEATLLGFNYDAELKFDAPCGSLLMCKARIVPKGVEDWPFDWQICLPSIKGDVKDLHDCDNHKTAETENSTKYRFEYKKESRCGLVAITSGVRSSVFGSDGTPILEHLPPAARTVFVTNHSSHNMSKKERKRARKWWSNWPARERDKDEQDMDRWAGYDEYYGIK